MLKITVTVLLSIAMAACAATPFANHAVPSPANVCQVSAPVGCTNHDGPMAVAPPEVAPAE